MTDCFVITIIALLFAHFIYGNASIEVNNEEDLYHFYEHWAKSENVEIFREKQRQYTMQLMNRSVDPCDDFFEFACGNFKSIIPVNNTWKMVMGLELLQYSQKHLQPKLLNEEVDPLEDEVFQKLKIFYRSCVDKSAHRREELTNFVTNFAAWPILQGTESTEEFDWLNVTAHAAQYEVFPMFKITFDTIDDIYRIWFLNTDADFFDLDSFKSEARRLSIDLEGKDADMAEIGVFVNKIANLQKEWKLLGSREEFKLSDLAERFPAINFMRYLQVFRGVRRVSPNEIVVLDSPIYFQDLSYIIDQTDSRVIANYVFVRFVEEGSKLLAKFKTQSTSDLCAQIVQDSMKLAFLGLFAKHYFDEDAHAQAKIMVDDIHAEGWKVINESEWITPETKVKALEKIAIIKKNVGLPDSYRNPAWLAEYYKDLKIDRNSFVNNYFSAVKVKSSKLELTEEDQLQLFLGDPVTVNAFFNPYEKGTLELPAAILQPPVFHKFSAKYVNYGGAGAAAGHELMHGFDSHNILFDEKGAVGIWWDPRISSTYYSRAGCYYNQYGQYRIDSTNQSVDGGSTLGENVADNEGLKISLNAYKKWLQTNEETSNIMRNGELLTPVQAFYLAFAQLYCSAFTEEELEMQIEEDSHSPGVIRVIGTLSNSPDFAEAYKCPVGSKMNPAQKCRYLRK